MKIGMKNDNSNYDKIDQLLFMFLFFINIFVLVVFLTAMISVKITIFVLVIELLLLLSVFISYHKSINYINKLTYIIFGILVLATIFYISIIKYFNVIKWDGALYLLNAKMFLTGTPIIYAYYKPLTWSAFLSLGLVFNNVTIIPLITLLMFIISVYLFALTLTKNKVVALISSSLSIFIPVVLLWGLSHYAETYLAMLITLGFASYFHYNNTNNKLYYAMSVFLFTMAFLTRFTYGLLLLVPLFELFRKKSWFSSTIPVFIPLIPYLLYQQAKANNFLYPFTLYFKAAYSDYGHNVFSNSYYLMNMNSLFSWLLFILAIIGFMFLIFKFRNMNIFVYGFVLLLVTIYFLGFFHLKDVRYFMFAVPLITTSVAYLIVYTVDYLSKFNIKFYVKPLTMILPGILMILLLSNFYNVLTPQYKYTGKDILRETVDYLKNLDGEIISNSHVRMSWYTQKRVFSAVPIENLNKSLEENEIKYIVNFESSGHSEFKNTERLLDYGEIIKSFGDGFEKINVLEVT